MSRHGPGCHTLPGSLILTLTSKLKLPPYACILNILLQSDISSTHANALSVVTLAVEKLHLDFTRCYPTFGAKTYSGRFRYTKFLKYIMNIMTQQSFASLRPTAHQSPNRVKIPAGSGSTHLPQFLQKPHDMIYIQGPHQSRNALQDQPSVPELRVRQARLFQHLVFAPRQLGRARWQQMIGQFAILTWPMIPVPPQEIMITQ